jgi:hypothetical protein
MNDLTWLYTLNCFQEGLEQGTIVFHPVPQNVDDDNTESQLFKVVFILKTSINGHQNVTMALGLSDQLGIGKRAPPGFSDSQDFMIGEGLLKTRINAFV